ncbi:MAG TPA: hypothetical protein VMF55_10750 [Solirubrobacterales bacterium]|nr:hypothetical protein [Solirubrobacterales bacterium]
MKLRFSVLALVLALGAVAAVPAVAAGGKSYKTTVASVARGDEAVEGKIASPKAACLGHRLVRGEMFPGGAPIPLGNVYTDGSGRFSYHADFENAPPHLHFTVDIYVMSKSLGGGVLCEGARLKTMVH